MMTMAECGNNHDESQQLASYFGDIASP